MQDQNVSRFNMKIIIFVLEISFHNSWKICVKELTLNVLSQVEKTCLSCVRCALEHPFSNVWNATPFTARQNAKLRWVNSHNLNWMFFNCFFVCSTGLGRSSVFTCTKSRVIQRSQQKREASKRPISIEHMERSHERYDHCANQS